jgi:3-phenylpropionate/trans-cinnamate dioxygenase ferredoxin reductase subunit
MTGERDFGAVIVGAGHASTQLAQALRRFGWDRRITIVGEEPVLPYHRPPLSKDLLKGKKTFEQILIRQEAMYTKENIDLLLGERAVRIDRERKILLLENGKSLRYGVLALTTGAVPKRLPVPGTELEGVCYVRTVADIERMLAAVRPSGQAFVIGGGYIGLEAAASLRTLHMEVTVLEAQDRLLQRVTCPAMSVFFTRLHAEEGVQVHRRSTVTAIHGDTRVSAIEMQPGNRRSADLVIIGIGIAPNVALAELAGLRVDNGVVVDEYGRTGDPDIYAAGDCASFVHARYGRFMRLESVQNANDQAIVVAKSMCGVAEPYDSVPWFWSDQFDVKLQIAGLYEGYEQVIERGSSERGRSFSLCYIKDGMLLAVDAVNRPKDFVLGKKLIAQRATIDPALLADADTPLNAAVLEQNALSAG